MLNDTENQIADNQIAESKKVQNEDDEISLIDLFAVLIKRRKMIIGITVAAMIFIVVYSIISLKLPPEKSYLPNQYKVSANMLINDGDSSSSDSSSLSSLASLAGVSLSTSNTASTSSLVLYLVTSNPFLDAVIEEFDLIEKGDYTKSPVTNCRNDLKKVISAELDEDSGVLTLSCKDIDPQYAVDVVNFSVDWISNELDELGVDTNKITKENLQKNLDATWKEVQSLTYELSNLTDGIAKGRAVWTKDTSIEQQRIELELEAQKEVYTSLKSQLELTNVKLETEAPTFQILERPSVPDAKTEPSRGKLCIIVTFAAFFIAVFLAFLLNAIENIKKDPEAMDKLKKAVADGKMKKQD